MPWVPEVFYVECGTVLRRWDLNRILTADEIAKALDELMAWPSTTPDDSQRSPDRQRATAQ